MNKSIVSKNFPKTAKSQKEAVKQLRISIRNNESIAKQIEKMSIALNPLIAALSTK